MRTVGFVTRSATNLPPTLMCPFTPTISVSSFNGKNMVLVTGGQQSYSLSCSSSTGEVCHSTTIYKITVTGGPTPSLINLTPSGTNTITFSTSFNLGDTGVYSVNV